MATYDQAARDYVGRLMQQYTGGLVPATVAKVWLSAENGDSNNPYGVTGRTAAGQQYLIHYPTVADGVRAAAQLLLTGSPYAATRRALEAARGNAALVAKAIADSPWNAGAGGSPYYTRIFQAAGLWPGETVTSTSPSSGGSTPAQLASSGSEADAAKLRAALVAAGISTDPSHVLTEAEAVALTRKIYPMWRGGSLFAAGQTVEHLLSMKTLGTQGGEALQSVFDVLTFKWVPTFAVNASVLVAILALGYVGIRRVAG